MDNFHCSLSCLTHHQISNQVCIQCPNDPLLCDTCLLKHTNHNILPWDTFLDSLRHLIDDDATPFKRFLGQPYAQIDEALGNMMDKCMEIFGYLKQQRQQLESQLDHTITVFSDMMRLHKFTIRCENYHPDEVGRIIKHFVQLGEFKLPYGPVIKIPSATYITQHIEPFIEELNRLLKCFQDSLSKEQLFDQLTSKMMRIPPKQENKRTKKKIEVKASLKFNQYDEDQIESIIERGERTALIGTYINYLEPGYQKFTKHNLNKVKLVRALYDCILCKCNPKYQRINKRCYIKRHLYGPIELNQGQMDKMQNAFINRTDQEYLFDGNRIYFHDLQQLQCVYWSNLVISNEVEGTINFDTVIDAIESSQTKQCFLCKQLGPTLKCDSQDCAVWVHFICFKDLATENQKLAQQKFRFLCPKHVPKDYQRPKWPAFTIVGG